MDSVIQHSWVVKFITGNGTISAFFLMITSLFLKLLLISAYFSVLYAGIWCVKKFCHKKMGVRINYYCWYLLFASIALANLEANDYLKGRLYETLFTAEASYAPWLYLARCFLLSVWLLIIVHKLTKYLMLNRKIQKSFQDMQRSDYGEGLARQAADVLGLRGKITVLATGCIDSPLSYGIFKKVILLPSNFKEKYSSSELYLLILHEVAHIKNGDTAKLYLISIIECFLWLNPLIRLFGKDFKRDTEILCDNRVIGVANIDRNIYAGLILKECANRSALAGFAFSDSYYALENRLEALYRYKPEKHRYEMLAAAALAIVLTVSSVSYYRHTDNYLTINSDYNSKFRITVVSADFMSYEHLDFVAPSSIYKINDDSICVDKIALNELVRNFSGRGYEWVFISSDNFNFEISGFTLSGSGGLQFHIDELANASENNRYSKQDIAKPSLAEYLFLFIASKI